MEGEISHKVNTHAAVLRTNNSVSEFIRYINRPHTQDILTGIHREESKEERNREETTHQPDARGVE